MFPPPTRRLVEAISNLKKAAACRSCGRSPSSSSVCADADDRQKNDSTMIGQHKTSSSNYYDGSLLISPSCGCLFCKDCWVHSTADASTQSPANNDNDINQTATVSCPVCCTRCTNIVPRPIIASLMSEQHTPPQPTHEYIDEAECRRETETEALPQELEMSIDTNENNEEMVTQQLGALLGMLRQLKGAPSHTPPVENGDIEPRDHAVGEEVGVNIPDGPTEEVDITEDLLCEEKDEGAVEVEEHETEVPGTCLPLVIRGIETKYNNIKEPSPQHTTTSQNEEEEQEAETAPAHESQPSSTRLSAIKQSEAKKSIVKQDVETPTVRESQASSIRFSSIKQGEAKKRKVEHDAETPTVHESQISSIRLSSVKQSEVKKKKLEVDHDAETPTVHESQISSIRLSSIKQKSARTNTSANAVDEHIQDDDGGVVEEEYGTEVPGTNLSPLRPSRLLSEKRLKSIMDSTTKQFTRALEEIEENETEVPGTNLNLLHLHQPDVAEQQSSMLEVGKSLTQQQLERGRFEDAANAGRDQTQIINSIQSECQATAYSPLGQTGTEIPGTNLPLLVDYHIGTTCSPLNQTETEVPGTDLPSMAVNNAVTSGPLDHTHLRGYEKQPPQCTSEGPRRVSTSPVKARGIDTSPPKKRPHVENTVMPEEEGDNFITRDIRPWNIQSEPFMSQLTCDVKTQQHNIGRQEENTGQRNSSQGIMDQTETSPQHATISQGKSQTLYVAYDVLDQVEISALKDLHEQSMCKIVLNGVHGVSRNPGGMVIPFPAILLTHAVDEPAKEDKKQTTCYRSYSYLKAKALGARVVDARWIVDMSNAGIVLDVEKYEIGSDLESLRSLSVGELASTAPNMNKQHAMLTHKFDGITFGLLRGQDYDPSLELETDSQLNAQLSLEIETEPLTTLEIESLVKCWGGRVTFESLMQMDILLVDDWITLDMIVQGLQTNLKAKSEATRWSIDSWQRGELDGYIVNGALATDYGEEGCIQVRIPILRMKWLEDSICLGSLKSLDGYCCGILCL